jgi:hypothetical protein
VSYYQLTPHEIDSLRTFGALASFFFALAGTFLGVFLNIKLGEAFSNQPLPENAAIYVGLLGATFTWCCDFFMYCRTIFYPYGLDRFEVDRT